MRARRERVLLPPALHNFRHFIVHDIEIVVPRLGERAAGDVFVDHILQMLRDRMPRNKGLVLRLAAKVAFAEKPRGGLLDHPHPELFRMDRGAVKVHQDRLRLRLKARFAQGVDRGVAQTALDAAEGFILKFDDVDLFVVGGEDGFYAVFPRLKKLAFIYSLHN